MARLRMTDGALVFAGLAAAACGGDSQESEIGVTRSGSVELAGSGAAAAELRVAGVMIGKRVGTGNRITEPTFQFAPQDTVHISVTTEGSGPGQLTAAWRSSGGEIVQKTSEFARTGGENTTFSLAEPKGLKPGTYKVVVLLDNDSVDTKVFRVAK